MTKEEKGKLLDLLYDISKGHEESWASMEDDDGFWEAWARMDKAIRDMEVRSNEEDMEQ